MRLIEIENEIKYMIEEDINNPEIYNKIYDLIYFYLKRKHLLSCEQEYDEISHIGATDLYLKVYNGGVIHSWIGYISLAYRAYIREYYKLSRSELIETEGNPDLRDAIILMSSSSVQLEFNYNSIINIGYIEKIESVIDRVLDFSIYKMYTSEYYNAKLSIIISLVHNTFIPCNLSENNLTYVHMLFVYTRDKIINNIGFGKYNLKDQLWQYTMESRDTDGD